MKKLIKSKLFLQVIVASMVATLATAGIVGAVTTIGANINTAGTLNVDSGTLYVGTTDRVGVGTTTPFATLSVNTTAGDNAFVIGSSTATYLTVNTVGNLLVDTNTLLVDAVNNKVGIGSTTPFTALGITNTGTQLGLAYDGTNYSTLNTGSAGYLTVSPSGLRTGIATTTPLGTLAISTSAGVNPFIIGSSTATYLTVDTVGNLSVDTNTLLVDAVNNRVGIGSTTPGAMLSVGPTPTVTSATSTIDFSKPCFKMATDAGTVIYYRPCVAGCNSYSGGWATSTTSCF